MKKAWKCSCGRPAMQGYTKCFRCWIKPPDQDDNQDDGPGPDEMTPESRCPDCGEYYSDCVCQD